MISSSLQNMFSDNYKTKLHFQWVWKFCNSQSFCLVSQSSSWWYGESKIFCWLSGKCFQGPSNTLCLKKKKKRTCCPSEFHRHSVYGCFFQLFFTRSSESRFIIIPQFCRKKVFGIVELSTWLNNCPAIFCAVSLNWLIVDVNCFGSFQIVANWKIFEVFSTIN